MKCRGLSLLEAVVAIFLLAGGSLACFTLLLQAFRYQGRTQAISHATLYAEQTLEQIRQWALVPANFDANWAIYSDQNFAWGGMVAHTTVSELRRPGNVITDCYRVVSVEVSNQSRTLLRLSGQIGSPLRRNATSVSVTQETGAPALPADGSARFCAYLMDGTNVVPGVSFHWEMRPQAVLPNPGGLGTVDPIQPNQALLTHLTYSPTPGDPNVHYPGLITMRATCRYRGTIVQGESNPLELLAPP